MSQNIVFYSSLSLERAKLVVIQWLAFGFVFGIIGLIGYFLVTEELWVFIPSLVSLFAFVFMYIFAVKKPKIYISLGEDQIFVKSWIKEYRILYKDISNIHLIPYRGFLDNAFPGGNFAPDYMLQVVTQEKKINVTSSICSLKNTETKDIYSALRKKLAEHGSVSEILEGDVEFSRLGEHPYSNAFIREYSVLVAIFLFLFGLVGARIVDEGLGIGTFLMTAFIYLPVALLSRLAKRQHGLAESVAPKKMPFLVLFGVGALAVGSSQLLFSFIPGRESNLSSSLATVIAGLVLLLIHFVVQAIKNRSGEGKAKES